MPFPPIEPTPDEIYQIVQKSFRKRTVAMHLRDGLGSGSAYQDVDFASMFPVPERAVEAPWRLALITVLQAIEKLTDQQAAEMAHARLDWRYALSMQLSDTGFHASVLPKFRQRMIDHHAQDLLLEPILSICREQGLWKVGAKQHINSTLVLTIVHRLSGLGYVWRVIRTALYELIDQEPDWLETVITEDWVELYMERFELYRLPKSKAAQEQLLVQVGSDCWKLLQAAQSAETPQSVQNNPCIPLLDKTFHQYLGIQAGKVVWRDVPLASDEKR